MIIEPRSYRCLETLMTVTREYISRHISEEGESWAFDSLFSLPDPKLNFRSLPSVAAKTAVLPH